MKTKTYRYGFLVFILSLLAGFSVNSVKAQKTDSSILINPAYDITGDSVIDKNDGLIIIRYLFGYKGDSIFRNSNIDRSKTPLLIRKLDHLKSIGLLDVDGDGRAEPLSDGLIIIRYIQGVKDSSLVKKAINPRATRKTASQITAFLQKNGETKSKSHGDDINIRYDIDSDGRVSIDDVIVIKRYLFGFTGSHLFNKSFNKYSQEKKDRIVKKLNTLKANGSLDVDGDGKSEPLSDGLLLTRYKFGMRGKSLIDKAIGTKSSRKTASQIINFLKEDRNGK